MADTAGEAFGSSLSTLKEGKELPDQGAAAFVTVIVSSAFVTLL